MLDRFFDESERTSEMILDILTGIWKRRSLLSVWCEITGSGLFFYAFFTFFLHMDDDGFYMVFL